jgi:hypothetical protein
MNLGGFQLGIDFLFNTDQVSIVREVINALAKRTVSHIEPRVGQIGLEKDQQASGNRIITNREWFTSGSRI